MKQRNFNSARKLVCWSIGMALVLLAYRPAHIVAQQLPQSSNFLGQTYMMNPGVGGASGDFEVRSMNR